MWSNEYTAISPLPARAIWNALKALHEGRLTYEGSDTFVLHGPFAKGTRVSVTPVGQDTFESTIVDLVETSPMPTRPRSAIRRCCSGIRWCRSKAARR
ncbi:hypothetical protein [Mesorhizobium sp. B2-4-12]|uniref:hypothetical protein n=1 Tax=Mesorhizobium sp. B2-4-12 TaxID=2589937 RepID=UPI001FEF26AB|nr:hypothetical protein [Mesorhizobium sp. B2-4-12]